MEKSKRIEFIQPGNRTALKKCATLFLPLIIMAATNSLYAQQNQAESCLQSAQDSFDKKELTKAIGTLRACIGQYPENADLHILLGQVKESKGELMSAESSLRKAIILSQNSALAYYSLGVVLYKQNMVQQALPEANKAASLAPDNGDYHYFHGNILYRMKRYNEALTAYGKTVDLEPCHVGAINNRGTIFRIQGKFELAEKSYQQAIQCDSAYFLAYRNLGYLYLKSDLPEKAVQPLLTALTLRPEDPQAHYYLADALYDLGNFEKAITHYIATTEGRPGFAPAFFNLSLCYKNLLQWMKSLEAMQRAVRFAPGDVNYRIRLGDAYLRMEFIDQAMELYEVAISMDSQLPLAYYRLGDIYKEKENYQTAIQKYDAAFKFGFDSSKIHFKKGVAYFHLTRYKSALDELKQVQQTTVEYPKALFHLGLIHLNLDSLYTALVFLKEAYQIDSTAIDISYHLGLTQKRMSNYGEAVSAFQKVIKLNVNHTKAYYNLGQIWRLLGEQKKAQTAMKTFTRLSDLERDIMRFQRLISSRPDSTALYRELAKRQYTIQRYSEALLTIREGLKKDSHNSEAKALLSKIVAAVTRQKLSDFE